MSTQGSKNIYFVLIIVCYFSTLDADLLPIPLVKDSQQKDNYGPVTSFTNAYLSAFQKSPKLLELIVDNSVSSYEYSRGVYQDISEAFVDNNIQNYESLSKITADALYLTLPYWTKETHIRVIADTMALYLISQDILTIDNAASYGAMYSDVLMKNHPGEGELSLYTKGKSISVSAFDFLKSISDDLFENIAAYFISLADVCFSYSPVRKPSTEITAIFPPGKIPSALDVFGINAFTSAFVKKIDASVALKGIFYVSESAYVINAAWIDAAISFCTIINCYTPYLYSDIDAITLTYNYMTKLTYVKSIANGYAITLLGIGSLNFGNAEQNAHNLADAMEVIYQNLPQNPDLKSRIGVLFTAFEKLIAQEFNILNQFFVLIARIVDEMFAATMIRRVRH